MDWIETRTIDLPAPVTRLVTRAGVGIAGLQRIDYQLPPSGRGRLEKDMGPASLWCFDGELDVRRTIDVPGQLVTLCLDPSATRAGVMSRLDDHASIVQLLSTEEGRALASRRFDDHSVFGLALHGDLVAVGRNVRAWTASHGAKVELYRPDLTTLVDRLDVDDAGHDVALRDGVVVASGIDLHIWWPGTRRPVFGLYGSTHGPPGEVGGVVMSEDGRRVAVIHDRWHATKDAALVLDLEHLEVPPLAIRPTGSKQATCIALSPDGLLVALVLDTTDEVLLFRVDDGTEIARLPIARPAAIAWLDASSLVVGGSTLSVWRCR